LVRVTRRDAYVRLIANVTKIEVAYIHLPDSTKGTTPVRRRRLRRANIILQVLHVSEKTPIFATRV